MTLMTLDEKKETAIKFGERIIKDMLKVLDADEENQKEKIACGNMTSPIVVMLTAMLNRCINIQRYEPDLKPLEELEKGIKAVAIYLKVMSGDDAEEKLAEDFREHLRKKNYDID